MEAKHLTVDGGILIWTPDSLVMMLWEDNQWGRSLEIKLDLDNWVDFGTGIDAMLDELAAEEAAAKKDKKRLYLSSHLDTQ